ncbi:TonB-dependent receptor [Caulobacter soli]|uniref:TonB-dependent receptor n=1 Tax=Caulobacter soli TaxID=2708539 RepID=UPI0013ECCE38|nr:TonB-dependent receptor [Caulobacter soli]
MLLSTSAGIALLAAPAFAQDAGAASSTYLEEIIVTANKRAEKIQTVPASITAVNDQLLERLQANSIGDFAAYVPGLTVQNNGGDGNRVTIRGLSTGPNDISPSVGVYVDDAPFGAASGFALGALFSPDIDPFDLNQVEVLRGPQGTLYGASTLAGLVKYTTKDPSTTDFSGHVRLDYGQVADTGASNYTVRAGANVPLVTDKAALRVSGYYTKNNGDFTNIRTGESGLNDNARKGGRIALLLQPTDNLRIKLAGIYAQSDSPETGTVNGNAKTLQPTYGKDAGYVYSDSYSRSLYSVLQANVQYTLPNNITASSTTSYSRFKVVAQSDGTTVFQPALGPVLGPLLQFSAPINPQTRKFTQELRLASPNGEKFEWLGGLFFDREESTYHSAIRSTYMYGATPPPALAPTVALLANYQTADLESRYIEYAAFANGTYYVTPTFDIGAGVRYSRNDQHLTRHASGYLVLLGVTTPFATAESSDNVWTQSFNARWRFQPNSMLYARAARGYRPGGPNAVGTSFSPDTTWNYEVGIKSDALDGRLRATLAAYYIDWTNIQLNFFDGTRTITGNAGDARSQGLEGELTYAPVHGLTISANAAYSDAEMTALKPGAQGGAAVGDTLPYSSKWTSGLRADYYFPAFGGREANVGASLRYRSSSNTTFPGDTGNRFYKLPETTFFDIRGGLDLTDTYAINLQILNLFNKRPLTSASESLAIPKATADALGQPANLIFARGRTYSLSLTGKF